MHFFLLGSLQIQRVTKTRTVCLLTDCEFPMWHSLRRWKMFIQSVRNGEANLWHVACMFLNEKFCHTPTVWLHNVWEDRSCWHIAAAAQLTVKCFDFNKIRTMCQRRRKRSIIVSISLSMSFTEGERVWFCSCSERGKQTISAFFECSL